jgi:hypothetical protein
MPALIPLEWALRPPCLYPICSLNYVHPRIQMTIAGSVSGWLHGFISNADYIEVVNCYLVIALFKCRARSDGCDTSNQQPPRQMSNQGAACKKFWGVPVRNATKTPPSVCKKTPSVWEFQGIPKKGPFSSREFQWEFQRFPTSGIPALGIPGN